MYFILLYLSMLAQLSQPKVYTPAPEPQTVMIIDPKDCTTEAGGWFYINPDNGNLTYSKISCLDAALHDSGNVPYHNWYTQGPATWHRI